MKEEKNIIRIVDDKLENPYTFLNSKPLSIVISVNILTTSLRLWL